MKFTQNHILIILLLSMIYACRTPYSSAITTCCPDKQIGFPGTWSEGTRPAPPGQSQERAEADIMILAGKSRVDVLNNEINLHLEIKNDGDDDSRYVEAIVHLPVESKVIKVSASSSDQQKVKCLQCGHTLICTQKDGIMNVGELMTIDVICSLPRFPQIRASIGAYALGYRPADPNPSNNTFSWLE